MGRIYSTYNIYIPKHSCIIIIIIILIRVNSSSLSTVFSIFNLSYEINKSKQRESTNLTCKLESLQKGITYGYESPIITNKMLPCLVITGVTFEFSFSMSFSTQFRVQNQFSYLLFHFIQINLLYNKMEI